MLESLTVLLVCQLVGEVLTRLLNLPVPGPVLGMILLFLGLSLHGRVPEALAATTRGMLDHLSLLFVPAGVGVLLHVALVAEEWLAISTAVVGSTVLTIAVTALVMCGVDRLRGGADRNGEEGER